MAINHKPVKPVECRIYHDADNYKEYRAARKEGNTYGFLFEGHRWAYQVTMFDDKGKYDVIYRFVDAAELPETAEIGEHTTAATVLVTITKPPPLQELIGTGHDKIKAHGHNSCLKIILDNARPFAITLQKYVWFLPRNGYRSDPHEEWYVYLGDFRLKAFKPRDYKFPERAARSYVTALCEVLGVSFQESRYKPKPRKQKDAE